MELRGVTAPNKNTHPVTPRTRHPPHSLSHSVPSSSPSVKGELMLGCSCLPDASLVVFPPLCWPRRSLLCCLATSARTCPSPGSPPAPGSVPPLVPLPQSVVRPGLFPQSAVWSGLFLPIRHGRAPATAGKDSARFIFFPPFSFCV
jgi:hypothetical protein